MTTANPAAPQPDMARTAAAAHGWSHSITHHDDRGYRPARKLIDNVLGHLTDAGVTVPAAVTRPLVLADAITAPAVPESIEAFLDAQDLATLEPSAITDRIRDLTTETVAITGGAVVYESARVRLVEMAVDAVSEHADDLVEPLRPAWTPAAEVVDQARQVGITGDTDLRTVVQDDAMIPVWRELTPALETLERLDWINMRVVAVAGYALGQDEMPRTGLGEWISAAKTVNGPPALVLPSARPPVSSVTDWAAGRQTPAFLTLWGRTEFMPVARLNPHYLPTDTTQEETL
jgi:hypothetical protein